MKNFFQIIGVLTLFIVSFTYHSEVEKVVLMSDDLLDEIKLKAPNYKQDKKEAIITNNAIVPGINGMEVDINKSYNAMKQEGFFNENKLVYKKDLVTNKLQNNKDKYIVNGNQTLKQIALVFKIDLNDDTDKLVKILKQNKAKATFFVESQYAKENIDKLKKIVSETYTIGNLSNNDDYIWLKTLVTSSKYQKNNYCITEKEDKLRLDFCAKYNDYTIMTEEIIKDTPFIKVKNNLTNGKIIYFDVNLKLENELSNIVTYIISKGYDLVSLEKLLQE